MCGIIRKQFLLLQWWAFSVLVSVWDRLLHGFGRNLGIVLQIDYRLTIEKTFCYNFGFDYLTRSQLLHMSRLSCPDICKIVTWPSHFLYQRAAYIFVTKFGWRTHNFFVKGIPSPREVGWGGNQRPRDKLWVWSIRLPSGTIDFLTQSKKDIYKITWRILLSPHWEIRFDYFGRWRKISTDLKRV